MRALMLPVLAACAVAPTAAGAASLETAPRPVVGDLIDAALIATLRDHVATDVVELSVSAQNDKRRGIDRAGVARLETQWIGELASPDKPLIASTLANPVSSYLTRVQAHSGGLITEIILMDVHGLNVGQSAISADYDQSDEAKWQQTVKVGPDAVFIDEVEFDDERKIWFAQVSVSVADTFGNAAIGAAAFDINLTELSRRAGAQ